MADDRRGLGRETGGRADLQILCGDQAGLVSCQREVLRVGLGLGVPTSGLEVAEVHRPVDELPVDGHRAQEAVIGVTDKRADAQWLAPSGSTGRDAGTR